MEGGRLTPGGRASPLAAMTLMTRTPDFGEAGWEEEVVVVVVCVEEAECVEVDEDCCTWWLLREGEGGASSVSLTGSRAQSASYPVSTRNARIHPLTLASQPPRHGGVRRSDECLGFEEG